MPDTHPQDADLPVGGVAAPDPSSGVRLGGIPICIVTRFSFLGKSGWKSDASRSADLLFSADRLALRTGLFAAVNLRSLSAQSDQGFHHMVLTSTLLPGWALDGLNRALTAAYGDAARFSVVAAAPKLARTPVQQFLTARFNDGPVAQVVLDDDDGLAADFIETLRADLLKLDKDPPDDLLPLPYFISYANGYGLVLRDQTTGARLYSHRYPFINAGLTLIGRGSEKNILGIDHLSAPRRFGAQLNAGKPMFLRSVHDANDSRVTPTDRWSEVVDWKAEPHLMQRFPCLFDAAAPWQRQQG